MCYKEFEAATKFCEAIHETDHEYRICQSNIPLLISDRFPLFVLTLWEISIEMFFYHTVYRWLCNSIKENSYHIYGTRRENYIGTCTIYYIIEDRAKVVSEKYYRFSSHH